MNAQLSAEFVSFAADGGYSVAIEGDGIEVWNVGGEVRYLVHESGPWCVVESAYRAEDYSPEFQATRNEDVERYLTMRIGNGAVRSALGFGVLPVRPGLPVSSAFESVTVRDTAVELTSLDDAARKVMFLTGVERPAVLFSRIADTALDDLRRSLRDPLGAPAFAEVTGALHTRAPASGVEGRALSEAQHRLARHGASLFHSLAAKSGQALDDPLSIIPFDGGVAVVRALRGGGKIFVADDGSVMYRASSYTFERALEEFRAGERTPPESFR